MLAYYNSQIVKCGSRSQVHIFGCTEVAESMIVSIYVDVSCDLFIWCVCIYMYTYVYIDPYVCLYIDTIYMYTHTHTHTHTRTHTHTYIHVHIYWYLSSSFIRGVLLPSVFVYNIRSLLTLHSSLLALYRSILYIDTSLRHSSAGYYYHPSSFLRFQPHLQAPPPVFFFWKNNLAT